MEYLCIILIGAIGIFYLIGVQKAFYKFDQYTSNYEEDKPISLIHQSAIAILVSLGSWISVKKINNLSLLDSKEPPYMKHQIDELLQEGFFKVRPKFTNLKVEIYLAQNNICKDKGYPLMLFARNGYSIKAATFIPISISENPKILNSNVEILILPNEVEEIKQFIKNNWFNIMKFNNNEIGVNQLIHNFIKV